MIDVKDFIETYYGEFRPVENDITLFDFEEWKRENDVVEWDYPLDEYDHIAELHNEYGTNFCPVRFVNISGGYDYRFCEVPQ